MLKKLINIKKNDVVSIIGSGGKTTLLTKLSKELSLSKTLMTTTTKIYVPDEGDYDFISIGKASTQAMISNPNKPPGVYVIGAEITEDHKIIAFEQNFLERYVKAFDYAIIESDGSAKKLLKGWNDSEPVVLKNTTKTVGIINLKLLGKEINGENIHRHQIFMETTQSSQGQIVEAKHIKHLILDKKAMFKNAKGHKILFINMLDTYEDIERGKSFMSLFNKSELNQFQEIILGSLKGDLYYKWQ